MCIPSGRNKVTFKAIAEALYFPLARLPSRLHSAEPVGRNQQGALNTSGLEVPIHGNPVCLLIEILDKMKDVL